MYYRWAKIDNEWDIVSFESQEDVENEYFSVFLDEQHYFVDDFFDRDFEWGDWVEVPPKYKNKE